MLICFQPSVAEARTKRVEKRISTITHHANSPPRIPADFLSNLQNPTPGYRNEKEDAALGRLLQGYDEAVSIVQWVSACPHTLSLFTNASKRDAVAPFFMSVQDMGTLAAGIAAFNERAQLDPGDRLSAIDEVSPGISLSNGP